MKEVYKVKQDLQEKMELMVKTALMASRAREVKMERMD